MDNELNGNGVAIFNQGMYYEGDMLIHAPNGRGTLFLPAESMRVDVSEDVLFIIHFHFIIHFLFAELLGFGRTEGHHGW